MNTAELHLFYEPKDRLRLTIGDERSYHTVKPVWSAPLSRPNKYLALLDAKGEEITTIAEPEQLEPDSFAAAREELRRRYLTATVRSILSAKFEYGATYWHVSTDRGDRDFVTQNLQENAMWLSPTHLMLLDVDGNRFEIENTEELDERSRKLMQTIL